MPIVSCLHCGTSFKVGAARMATGRGRYCSRACQAAARTLERAASCALCGGPMPHGRRGRRFCSRECAVLAASGHVAPRMRRCVVCGDAFMPATVHDHCCSVLCEVRHAGVLPFTDPWDSGAIPPDCYGPDVFRMPDMVLGF